MAAFNQTWLDEIASCTDRNDHWEAALTIALRLGKKHERDIITAYQCEQQRRGHSLEGELATRKAVLEAMLERLPRHARNEIRACL